MKINFKIGVILFSLLIIPLTLAQIQLFAGSTFFAKISTEVNTERWAGMYGKVSGQAEESNLPFLALSIDSSQIINLDLPGENFMDGKHYYAALPQNETFNLTKVKNITAEDLEEYGIFNSSNFPIFHPNYYSKSDNPKKTFCCKKKEILLGGKGFTAFEIELEADVTYYLLKYDVETTQLPLFLVEIKNYTCYDGNSCNYEVILPVGKTYYFYILSKERPIKFDVWIDGVKRTDFEYTAIPFNVTVRATHLYTGEPLNLTLAVYEREGNNLFVLPLDAGVYFSQAFGFTQTDENGYAKFVVAPTKYQSSSFYKIAVAALTPTFLIEKELELQVDANEINYIKKTTPVSPFVSDLKDGINWLRPIANCLFKYASNLQQASRISINGANVFYVNRGIPYIIDTVDPSAAYIEIEEKNGYLILMPAHRLELWNFSHVVFNVSNKDIIITPTLDGGKIFKAKIYDSNKNLLYEVIFNVTEATCQTPSSLEFFSSQKLKDAINSVRPVLNSLYYSVN